jgi:uncharacterized membrane protein YraQ (UPF0718 family)/copper chaperone CopZ
MHYLTFYISKLVLLVMDMAPWLLLGFLIAGLLHVFFPEGKINNLLGKSNMKSVFRAALIGVPLPLCSCGVIPTGVSIHKNGASKGAAISFLISTPQTGVDSIMVTYSLLGLPFAILRPVIAFFTGIMGGALTNKFEPDAAKPITKTATESLPWTNSWKKTFIEIFRYAFVDLLTDIAKWLVIGLSLAALIAVFVPDDFFSTYIHNDFLGMLIILAISVPLYVCATSSVPIAAVLMMKGISPGAALVFLMAGPATNAATISVIGNSMGKKTVFLYLFTIISGALFSGLFIDYFLPRQWFTSAISHIHHGAHNHDLLPDWLKVISGIVIVLLLLNIFIRNLITRIRNRNSVPVINELSMNDVKVYVRGMTCTHCKMSVETNLKKLDGVDKTVADLNSQIVTISGEKIDLDKVKETIEGIGYKYDGKVA